MADSDAQLPRVAVLLAAYNGMQWIEQQLDSILKQQGVSLKIFVSTDQSTDNTLDFVEKLALKYPCIVVLPYGDRFGGAAQNFFRLLHDVDFSEFSYVCFSDQDDIWLPNKLLRAHEVLLKTAAGAYSSNVLAFWPNGRQHLVEKSQKQVKWDFLFEAAGPGCTYVMRQSLACTLQAVVKNRWAEVQQVGLHDWFAYAFARANGYRWVIDDYAGMLYRQHANNQVGVNKGWRAWRHRAHKVLGGWGLAQSALIADLVGLGDDAFVKRWSGGGRAGLLWLACHGGQCRRRGRDKLLFALSCLAMSLLGGPRS